jgi:preprotein translocase subunit SecB
LVLVYQLLEDAPEFDDDHLEAFGAFTGVFAAHPYVREALQNLTIRLGLPPLVLDVVRMPIDAPALQTESGEPGDTSTQP